MRRVPTPSKSMPTPGLRGSMSTTSTSRCPRPMRCSAAWRAPPTSSISTVGWSGRALESTVTIGSAGGAELLDLRVARRQADDHRPVDRRPVHRAGERAVQGRDEVERVALLLGGERDALRERPEEGVGEDDRQRLGGEHADGPRRALGEHPGDRVGPVAERVGDGPDPGGGLGRQPARAVERKRHGRLRDAGLAGDVGDARTAPGPLLHGYLGCGARATVDDGRSSSRDRPVVATTGRAMRS